MKILQQAVNNFKSSLETREYPLCFDDKKQWDSWLLLESEAKTNPARKFACRDCSAEYQNRMVMEGRCVNFAVDVSKIVK